MGMLNAHDIDIMKSTVREIISEWNDKITVYSMLPLDQQTNYNKNMREFTGDIKCSRIVIDAERKDIVNNQTNNPDIDNNEYGLNNTGVILYAIPDIITTTDGVVRYKPSLNDIVKIDTSGDIYFIRFTRDRMGETLVTLNRFTGKSPLINEADKDNIFIQNYNWGDKA